MSVLASLSGLFSSRYKRSSTSRWASQSTSVLITLKGAFCMLTTENNDQNVCRASNAKASKAQCSKPKSSSKAKRSCKLRKGEKYPQPASRRSIPFHTPTYAIVQPQNCGRCCPPHLHSHLWLVTQQLGILTFPSHILPSLAHLRPVQLIERTMYLIRPPLRSRLITTNLKQHIFGLRQSWWTLRRCKCGGGLVRLGSQFFFCQEKYRCTS